MAERSFKEALEMLGIEDYEERIFNSNSHGELIHLMDYFLLAETFGDAEGFREWFESIVKWAEESWSRPESIFQHIPRCLRFTLEEATTQR